MVLQTPDHILMLQVAQKLALVSEMFLLSGEAVLNYFQHYVVPARPIDVDL